MPALFTMTCSPPNFSTAVATGAPTCAGIGDIRALESAAAPRAAASASPRPVDVGDDDARALRRKPLYYASTDTRGPAGDERDLVRQFVDHPSS